MISIRTVEYHAGPANEEKIRDTRVYQVSFDPRSRTPSIHYSECRGNTPEGKYMVRSWQRLGEVMMMGPDGVVTSGYVSLVIDGNEYSAKYIENHYAEISSMLENERVMENLEEL